MAPSPRVPYRRRPHRSSRGLLAALLCAWLVAHTASAADPLALQWHLRQSDGSVRLEQHKRVYQASPDGGVAEFVRSRTFNASYVHLARAITPTYAIDDFRAAVPVRADQPGLQLLARVVYPRSRHPSDGRPLTTLVGGKRYEHAGHWETLELSNLREEVRSAAQVLRARFATDVDVAGAYIDTLVLNVYTNPGAGEAWIGELELTGLAPLSPEHQTQLRADQRRASSEPKSWDSPLDGPSASSGDSPAERAATDLPAIGLAEDVADASRVRQVGDQMLVAGRPFFARAITYRGEACQQLAARGFNTIVLIAPPDTELLEAAAAAGLWWATYGTAAMPAAADPLFYSRYLGTLPAEPSKAAGTSHGPVRVIPLRPGERQLAQQHTSASDRDDPFASGTSPSWQAASQPTLHWTTLRLQAPAVVLQQAQAILQQEVIPFCWELSVLRNAVRSQLRAGCRGVWFQSDHSLDQIGNGTTVDRLNAELELIEPWLAAGTVVGEQPREQQIIYQHLESQLIVPWTAAAELGRPAGPRTPARGLAMEGAGSYLMSITGIDSVGATRIPGGVRLAGIDAAPDACYLITSDSRIVQQVNYRCQFLSRRVLPAELKRIEFQMAQIRRLPNSPQQRLFETQIDAQLTRSQRILIAQQPLTALAHAQQADRLVQRWSQLALQQEITLQPAVLGSPCSRFLPTLAAAMQLARDLEGRISSPNLLPTGSCESAQDMESAGWRLTAVDGSADSVPLRFTQSTRRDGHYALLLGSVEPGSLSVESRTRDASSHQRQLDTPEVECSARMILRFSGWVHVSPEDLKRGATAAVYGSWEGSDPLVELSLAPGWLHFDHYFLIPSASTVRLQLRVSGGGQFAVDQLELFAYRAGAHSTQLASDEVNSDEPQVTRLPVESDFK